MLCEHNHATIFKKLWSSISLYVVLLYYLFVWPFAFNIINEWSTLKKKNDYGLMRHTVIRQFIFMCILGFLTCFMIWNNPKEVLLDCICFFFILHACVYFDSKSSWNKPSLTSLKWIWWTCSRGVFASVADLSYLALPTVYLIWFSIFWLFFLYSHAWRWVYANVMGLQLLSRFSWRKGSAWPTCLGK